MRRSPGVAEYAISLAGVGCLFIGGTYLIGFIFSVVALLVFGGKALEAVNHINAGKGGIGDLLWIALMVESLFTGQGLAGRLIVEVLGSLVKKQKES